MTTPTNDTTISNSVKFDLAPVGDGWDAMSGYAAQPLLEEKAKGLQAASKLLRKECLPAFQAWASSFARSGNISLKSVDSKGFKVSVPDTAAVLAGSIEPNLVLLGNRFEYKKDGSIKKPNFFAEASKGHIIADLVGESTDASLRVYGRLSLTAHDVHKDAEGKESSKMITAFQFLWDAVNHLAEAKPERTLTICQSVAQANDIPLERVAQAVQAGLFTLRARQCKELGAKLLSDERNRIRETFEKRRNDEKALEAAQAVEARREALEAATVAAQ